MNDDEIFKQKDILIKIGQEKLVKLIQHDFILQVDLNKIYFRFGIYF